jgi:UDP-glucose 4-epimerase
MTDNKNILVIGGTGVIGHFVTRQLVEQGYRPVVLTVSGRADLIADVADRCAIVTGDILDADSLTKLMAEHQTTHIVHLGAFLKPEQDPVRAIKVCVEGMANVLNAAKANGVKRVVHTSTKGVYGPVRGEFAHPSYKPLVEDMPEKPASVYGTVKLAGEHLGRIYHARHGIEWVAVRFGSTIGPAKSQRHGNTNPYSKMIENAMLGVPAQIEKGGDAVTDSIFNGDAADGVVRALHAEKPASVYNIASGYGFTLRDFADAVRTVYPKAEIEVGPGTQWLHPDTTGHCVLDISRARQDLGYKPRHDIRGIVSAYVATMERLGLEPIAT